MERIVRQLLIGLLAWLLAVPMSAWTCHAAPSTAVCRSRPGEHQPGHRSHIPVHRTSILSGEDEGARASRIVELPGVGMPHAEPVASDASLADAHLLPPVRCSKEPLYLILRTLLL